MTRYVCRQPDGTLELADLDPACPEAELQDAVVELAYTLHYLVHHDRPAWTSKGYRTAIQGHVGFPDVVLARDETEFWTARRLWVECKAAKGRISADQQLWIDVLRSTGETVYIWKPAQWNDRTIERVLRGDA